MPYTALSPFTTNVIGSGQEKNGLLGAYDVNAEAGRQLLVRPPDPSTPSAEIMLRLYRRQRKPGRARVRKMDPMILLIIDFLVSSAHGEAGGWKIAVAPVPGETLPQAFSYDLTIQGFSGLGPVNPSPVPEPSTWVMAFVGLAGLGLMGFRRARCARARPLPVRL